MDRTALHLEVRNALSVADELSRHEHFLGQDDLAGTLSALKSALSELEREVGRSHAFEGAPSPEVVEALERSLGSLTLRRGEFPRALKLRASTLLGSAERISIALWDPGERVPSKPIFLGVLPVARVVPQDVHSVLDYGIAAGLAASAVVARTNTARIVGATLAAGMSGASAVTDYRLSVAKLIPIEAHERLDFAGGIAAVAAPFVLGYAKKDPIAAAMHVGIGLATIVTSLFTDYRATRGVTWPIRSKGGPSPRMRGDEEMLRPGKNGVRVTEVQRPLEGLSSSPSAWDAQTDQLTLDD